MATAQLKASKRLAATLTLALPRRFRGHRLASERAIACDQPPRARYPLTQPTTLALAIAVKPFAKSLDQNPKRRSIGLYVNPILARFLGTAGMIPRMPPAVEDHSPSTFSHRAVDHVGFAQLSIIETALYPLDRRGEGALSFGATYSYSDPVGKRVRADVKVGAAFEPLKANDDFFLWSLLSLTLRHSENHTLVASPYWLLKNIGLPTGGFQYAQLRQVVERLAQVVYSNSGFYNPISQEHERWTFAFFASHLPDSLDADRLWKIVWNQPFMEVSRATGGRLLFDLELFHRLGSPATRRLFLKLSDRFYRANRVYFDVDDLTVNGLGLSATRPLKKRKYDLTRCIETLLEHQIITLGKGHANPRDLFLKRGKGRYVVVFFKGPFFAAAVPRTAAKDIQSDPLYDPMRAIGVDPPMIRKLLGSSRRTMIERWLKITEAAMKDKPAGFPGFKVSSAAFFIDGVLNQRMPPDWMHQFEKIQRRKAHEAEITKASESERHLAVEYESQRRDAIRAFASTSHGKELYQSAYQFRLAVNLRQGDPPEIARASADKEAIEMLGRSDEFSFPELAVWRLERAFKS